MGPGGQRPFPRLYERQGWQPDGSVKRDTIGNADVLEVRYRRTLNGRTQDG